MHQNFYQLLLSVNMTRLYTFLPVLLAAITLLTVMPPVVKAQSSSDYALGNALLRQGEYEQAYDVFERLMRQNPSSYPVYDRAMTALINLRRLDEAINITQDRLDSRYADFNTWIKLGELYHIDRQFEKATETWLSTLDQYGNEMQVYRQVAETMKQRRDYEGAIKVYDLAREKFRNPALFLQEAAQAYLAAGDYERGMQEYLRLIETNHNFVYAVQRQLTRFDEPYLYDIAILETEDAIADKSSNTSLVNQYNDFLIWLQIERELYRRAMATSRNIERENPDRYAIYDLGVRLLAREEFELAEDAFLHYYNQDDHPHRARAMQELAGLYMDWAQYKIARNIDFDNSSRELYRKASTVISEITSEYPDYNNQADILRMQVELSLDFLKDLEKAETYFEQFEAIATRNNLENEAGFLKGRLKLFRGEFAMARYELSRVNRAVRSGSLADESRYYLALGDFYNGDYEFSRIQLRSLERHNTSFFANNALQVRVWIQSGVQKNDSLKTEMNLFAKAHYYFSTGKYHEALEQIDQFLSTNASHPLTGEVLLLASNIIRNNSIESAFELFNEYAHTISHSVTKERLLWERANLAHLIYQKNEFSDDPQEMMAEERFYSDTYNLSFIPKSRTITITSDDVVELFEELLIEFPHGFYAQAARNIIREHQQSSQTS